MPGWEVVGAEEAAMVQQVFESGGVLMAHGFDSRRTRFFVREFEQACSEAFRSGFCQAVSSGSAATRIALQSVGVGPGDEVITQAFNFISTVEAIRDIGAVPVIVNCDRDLHIDLGEVKSSVSPRTRAVVAVHMLGVPGPLTELGSVCRDHRIALIEDACEAVGAEYQGRSVGTLSDVGIFSFDHGKMVSTGEGGLVLTESEVIARIARSLHDHGHAYDSGVPRNLDSQLMPGFNFRMSELQAAVGIAQLRKLPGMLEQNRVRAQALVEGVAGRLRLRSHSIEARPTDDTVMFIDLSRSLQQKVIGTLAKFGLGTKNVPDALRWHFAGHWDKLLDTNQRGTLGVTERFLGSSVAIPILLSKPIDFYHELGEAIAAVALGS